MSSLSFAPVPKTEEARAYQTLVSAFTDDPVERWLYPELPEYLTHFPEFLAAFGGRAFDEQTVWGLGECSAVALWLPPGQSPMAMPSVLCSWRPFRRASTATPSLSSNKWTLLIPRTRTGISRGLEWMQPSKVGLGRGVDGPLPRNRRWIIFRRTWRPPTHALSFYRRHGFEETGTAQEGSAHRSPSC